MEDLSLNQKVIQKIKEETPEKVKKLMGNDLKKVILYGSCARGNYTADSDIDIALITAGDRMSVKKYSEELRTISHSESYGKEQHLPPSVALLFCWEYPILAPDKVSWQTISS